MDFLFGMLVGVLVMAVIARSLMRQLRAEVDALLADYTVLLEASRQNARLVSALQADLRSGAAKPVFEKRRAS